MGSPQFSSVCFTVSGNASLIRFSSDFQSRCWMCLWALISRFHRIWWIERLYQILRSRYYFNEYFLFVVTVLVLQWVPAFRPPYFQPTIPCLGCWRLFVFSVYPFNSILYSSHQEWFPKSQTSSLQSFVLTELLLDSNTISCQDCGNRLDTAPAIKNYRLVWEKRETASK